MATAPQIVMPVCRKCGSTEVRMRWGGDADYDYLACKCRRCEFSWREPTADKREKGEP